MLVCSAAAAFAELGNHAGPPEFDLVYATDHFGVRCDSTTKAAELVIDAARDPNEQVSGTRIGHT